MPYLEATSHLNASELSAIVRRVAGSVFSTLFAGLFADWMGRKSAHDSQRCRVHYQHPGDCAVAGYAPLFLGRLLQE